MKLKRVDLMLFVVKYTASKEVLIVSSELHIKGAILTLSLSFAYRRCTFTGLRLFQAVSVLSLS